MSASDIWVDRIPGDFVFAARASDYMSRVALIEGAIDVAGKLAADALNTFAEQDERQGVAVALDSLAAAAAVRRAPYVGLALRKPPAKLCAEGR